MSKGGAQRGEETGAGAGAGADETGGVGPLDAIWDALKAHAASWKARPIADLFALDPLRAETFSLRLDDMLLDYSKTGIDTAARDLLLSLARTAGIEGRRDAMFAGEKINETEGRAVLHVALRNPDWPRLEVDGADVMAPLRETLSRMEAFAEGVRSGEIAPARGGRFSDVVNIGIGGSDLGPAMGCRALAPWHDGPRCHFVSNIDGAHLHDTLAPLDPARTLVVIASKTFTTIETMTNAAAALRWLESALGAGDAPAHLVAVSSAEERAAAWGIPPERVFGFEDWVGGRYSMWGPVGLSLMIGIGAEDFRSFLRGGAAMDAHFRTAPLAENMPVMLALTGLWHRQVNGMTSRAVIPYDQRLARLPAYLQQLEMESNGKSVTMSGAPLRLPSSPVIWGEPGTNGQHAFFQQLHQGTDTVPCEFLIAARGHEPELAEHHRLLMANCLAQSEALMRGRSLEEARAIVADLGFRGAEAERQARHRVFPGSRPSITLAYRQLDPFTLGRIIALYEHRVFVEGAILGINSFDQWGVELGKELALSMVPLLEGNGDASGKDGSTRQLLAHLRELGEA